MRCLVLLTPALLAASASAEPVSLVAPTPSEPPDPVDPPAEEVPAPRPDHASGVVVEDESTTSERARVLPRALLFLPRIVLFAVVQPVRAGAYVFQRYNLAERFTDATFTDDRRFGIYPVANYAAGFGFMVGARLLYKDILGDGERFKLRADYGGQFRYAVGAHLGTGTRFGRIRFEADSSSERRPREQFYGIGNGELTTTLPDQPIDPSLSAIAFKSRFQEDVLRNVLTANLRITDRLQSRTSSALMIRKFDRAADMDITEAFDTSKLTGYDDGVRNIYVENELIYDSRRPASPYATQVLDGTGWLIRGYGGIARGIDKDPSKYFTYGGEIQRYFDLYQGTRTFTVRAMLDAVGGTDGRSDGRISFIDLPRLGGAEYLRGYPSARFRDRAVVLATAEYNWEIMSHASAFTFIDVGEPFAAYGDLGKNPIRVGYGGGIQLHTKHTFFVRLQFARSRDGDTALNLAFAPTFGRRERAGRF